MRPASAGLADRPSNDKPCQAHAGTTCGDTPKATPRQTRRNAPSCPPPLSDERTPVRWLARAWRGVFAPLVAFHGVERPLPGGLRRICARATRRHSRGPPRRGRSRRFCGGIFCVFVLCHPCAVHRASPRRLAKRRRLSTAVRGMLPFRRKEYACNGCSRQMRHPQASAVDVATVNGVFFP